MTTTDLFLEKDAVISDCGTYRYLLRRTWDHNRQRALFVMLNPSTADADNDDPTIRSCIRLCRFWGYGSFEVVNLFAFRSTDPNALLDAADPVGPRNIDVIEAAANRCDAIICAWGAHKSATYVQAGYRPWGVMVFDLLGNARRPAIFCLGTTKSGAPKHPLYIKTGTPLVRFDPRRSVQREVEK